MPDPRRPFSAVRLDARSGAPVYLQLFSQIQRLASAGRLRPGERLPTVRELAVQLGVNFNTVARAYHLLDRAGLVSAQQGRGTFVLDARANARGNKIALRALASHYIAESRRHGFSAAQIAAAVADRLAKQSRPHAAGENHG
jgi:GntR family transcriptional regulator